MSSLGVINIDNLGDGKIKVEEYFEENEIFRVTEKYQEQGFFTTVDEDGWLLISKEDQFN